MIKTYSGERIPGTVNYHVFVSEGYQKREVLLDYRMKIGELVSDSELTLRNELAYRICLAILIDFTSDITLSESSFQRFKQGIENILCEDHWILHSARIEGFLSRLQGEPDEVIADYSFFDKT